MRVRLKDDVKVKMYVVGGPENGTTLHFCKGLEGEVVSTSTWYDPYNERQKTIYNVKFDNYRKDTSLVCDDRILEFVDKSANVKSHKINKYLEKI